MQDLIDLDRYPIDRPESPAAGELVARCRREMNATGMVNLDGFLLPAAIKRAAEELLPLCASVAYTHRRQHNVYFEDRIDGLTPAHAALARFHTVHHTLCADQVGETVIHRVYEWAPLPAFLARVLGRTALHLMSDPLARVNVIEYRPGETLNWHFDRSQFTTTLLIQPAEQGGEFEYRSDVRSELDQNYAGVARFLRGVDPDVRVNPLGAGTLNVFAGRNTLHRVSTVRGHRSRLVAVYSYYEQPDVVFSAEERLGFYGRAH
ncbi:MAG: hypothetical protein NVSMB10_18530 [Steroidobacteraceae bacterium]